jgi:hypothetical protein
VKTLADNFSDWEGSAFGFGYGTGEHHTIPALRQFLLTIPDGGSYDYQELERACGPVVAWLLLNVLAHQDIIEYGTSPRYGWLTPQGRSLRKFVAENSLDDLIALSCRESDYTHCYPDACNCGPDGYLKGRLCGNPFWREAAK